MDLRKILRALGSSGWRLSATALTTACCIASAFAEWPQLSRQLQAANVRPNTALERLILDNQDFGLLRPEEATDTLGIPPWLRVHWCKRHPDGKFSAADPTGGYPRVLKNMLPWMMAHQDLLASEAPPLAADGDGSKLASVGGNIRISGAQVAPRSESDIRVNFWDPAKIIGASNNIGSGGQAQFYSTDSGVTWNQTTLAIAAGDAFHSDPTVDWTSDGAAWSTTLGVNAAQTVLQGRAFKSTNNGATWTVDATFSGAQTVVDKQMMWIDHSASSPFANNIYVVWHNGPPAWVNRRTAAGWQTPIQVSGAETTGTAIGSDIKTNSSGDVFAFWPATGNRKLLVAKSTNGGVSFGTPVQMATTFDSYDIGMPSFASRRALIYTAGGAFRTPSRNEVYVSWTDLTGAAGCDTAANEPGANAASTCKTRIWFSRSSDGGATWSAKIMINNQATLNDQYNQSLAVDEATGQIAISYYDTVADPTRKKTDLWYQSSADGGVTWSVAVKVSSAQTDETVASANAGNQYGDYNGLSGYAGIFYPSWTDRRNDGVEEIWTARIDDRLPLLDLDGSAPGTRYAAATDGLLLLRYLLGFRGAALTNNATGATATRNAAQIAAHIENFSRLLDIDGDNLAHASSDGLMVLRYMLGMPLAAVVNGAKPGSRTPAQVEAAILRMMP